MKQWSLTLHGPTGILSQFESGEAQFVLGTEEAPDVLSVAGEGIAPRHARVWITEGRLQAEGLPDWQQPSKDWIQTDEHPVVNISWNKAKEFCDWLSAKTGREWRLPRFCAKASSDSKRRALSWRASSRVGSSMDSRASRIPSGQALRALVRPCRVRGSEV